MEDGDLANYLPSYGDRLALFNFCRNQQPISKRKLGLFHRLRHKLKLRKGAGQDEEENQDESDLNPSSSATPTRQQRTPTRHQSSRAAPTTSQSSRSRASPMRRQRASTRTIEIGWLHRQNNETKQIRTKQGGGTRKVVMDVSSGMDDILQKGKSLFFPQGISTKGPEIDFDFELCDHKLNPVVEDITISVIYETLCMTRLRFYLSTQPKQELNDDSEKESYGNNIEDDEDHSTLEMNSKIYGVSSLLSLDGSSAPVISDANVNSDGRFITVAELLPSSFVVDDAPATIMIDLTDPEVTFGPHPQEETSDNDTLLYNPADVSQEQQPQMIHPPSDISQEQTPPATEDTDTKWITIHHGNCLKDMIKAFSDPDILSQPLMVKRLLPDNSEEPGFGSGVERDVYSCFWEEFYDRCTLGTTIKVPFIRHDFTVDAWKAIGRILDKGYKDWQYFPIKLARPFIEEMLYGVVQADLTESFLQYVSDHEGEIREVKFTNAMFTGTL